MRHLLQIYQKKKNRKETIQCFPLLFPICVFFNWYRMERGAVFSVLSKKKKKTSEKRGRILFAYRLATKTHLTGWIIAFKKKEKGNSWKLCNSAEEKKKRKNLILKMMRPHFDIKQTSAKRKRMREMKYTHHMSTIHVQTLCICSPLSFGSIYGLCKQQNVL